MAYCEVGGKDAVSYTAAIEDEFKELNGILEELKENFGDDIDAEFGAANFSKVELLSISVSCILFFSFRPCRML